MTVESLEEHRQRLLRDESVQEMIRTRAFEIYLMRGVLPGGPAQDWFQAESEVLAFLLAHHPEPIAEKEIAQVAFTPVADALSGPIAPKRKTRSAAKGPAAKKAAPKKPKPKKAAVAKPKSTRPRKEATSEDETK